MVENEKEIIYIIDNNNKDNCIVIIINKSLTLKCTRQANEKPTDRHDP